MVRIRFSGKQKPSSVLKTLTECRLFRKSVKSSFEAITLLNEEACQRLMFYASQSILEMDLFQMLVVSAFQLRLSKSEQISKSISEVEERVTVWRIQRYLIPSNTLPPHARKKRKGIENWFSISTFFYFLKEWFFNMF